MPHATARAIWVDVPRAVVANTPAPTAKAIVVLLLVTIQALAVPIVATFRAERGQTALMGVVFVCALILGLSLVWVVHIGRAANAWFPYESLLLVTMYLYFISGLFFFQAAAAGFTVLIGFVAAQLSLGDPRQILAYEGYYLFLANCIGMIGLYILERQSRRYFLLENELREQAALDSLTGLMNRRAFHTHFDKVWLQAQREKTTVGLMLVDIDDFKQINDTCGHPFGDNALVQVARELRACAQRPLDAVSRYGGDEVVVVWYGIDRHALEKIAEELPGRLKGISCGDSKNPQQIRISGGAVLAIPALGTNPSEVIRIADQKMYEMKRNRRGTIACTVLTEAPAN
jgi:diguanylate cyclase (GGDEF)-like protein